MSHSKQGHGVNVFRVTFNVKKSKKRFEYKTAIVVADNANDAIACSAGELELHVSCCSEVQRLNEPQESVFLAV